MADQSEVLIWLKKHREKQDCTIKELMVEFQVGQPSMNRIVRQLEKFKFVEIRIDGRKKLIRVRK